MRTIIRQSLIASALLLGIAAPALAQGSAVTQSPTQRPATAQPTRPAEEHGASATGSATDATPKSGSAPARLN